MTKSLRIKIMLLSRLHNKFRKKNVSNCTISNKILWATLLRKAKINYHEELNNRILNNNRKFWKTVNPLLSEKACQKESITITGK